MLGFINFILIFGIIGFVAFCGMRYIRRARARNVALRRAKEEWDARSTRLNAAIDDLPREVLSGYGLVSAAMNGNVMACDAFDAALQMELRAPSDEGEIAHMRDADRADFVESAAIGLGVLALNQPRRWDAFVRVLRDDPSLAGRAAVKAHHATQAHDHCA